VLASRWVVFVYVYTQCFVTPSWLLIKNQLTWPWLVFRASCLADCLNTNRVTQWQAKPTSWMEIDGPGSRTSLRMRRGWPNGSADPPFATAMALPKAWCDNWCQMLVTFVSLRVCVCASAIVNHIGPGGRPTWMAIDSET